MNPCLIRVSGVRSLSSLYKTEMAYAIFILQIAAKNKSAA